MSEGQRFAVVAALVIVLGIVFIIGLGVAIGLLSGIGIRLGIVVAGLSISIIGQLIEIAIILRKE